MPKKIAKKSAKKPTLAKKKVRKKVPAVPRKPVPPDKYCDGEIEIFVNSFDKEEILDAIKNELDYYTDAIVNMEYASKVLTGRVLSQKTTISIVIGIHKNDRILSNIYYEEEERKYKSALKRYEQQLKEYPTRKVEYDRHMRAEQLKQELEDIKAAKELLESKGISVNDSTT